MELINALVLIVGGVLAISGLIIARKPDARRLIDRIRPYQSMVGVALLVIGLIELLRGLGRGLFDLLRVELLLGLAILGVWALAAFAVAVKRFRWV